MDWFTYTLIILGLGLFALLCFYYYKSTFKYKVVLRELTGNGSMLINYDIAKSVIDKDSNTETWKLWHEKVILTPPPSDAIEIDMKGRKFAELYKKGDYDFVWIVDNHTTASLELEMLKEAKKNGISSSNAWRPVSASSKFAWLNQTKKAQEMKGKGWMDILTQAMPYIMIMIVLVVGYLMWDSQNEANIETTKIMSTTMTRQQESLDRQTAVMEKWLAEVQGVQTFISQNPAVLNATRVAPN